MLRKFGLLALFLLALSVYAEDKKAMVIGSSKELKGISAPKIIWKKDGAEMVLIPAHPSIAETTPTETTDSHLGGLATSNKEVTASAISSFYMDACEITVGQFKNFIKSSGYKPAEPIDWNQVYENSATDQHPMIMLSWQDASAYAKWAEKRLPAEKEWEFAAKGGISVKWHHRRNRVTHDEANYSGASGKDKWKRCAPVGSFPPNKYGLYDMEGNVSEWCQDWYDKGKTQRVLRGGSWYFNLKVPGRNLPLLRRAGRRYYASGFRCVVDVQQ